MRRLSEILHSKGIVFYQTDRLSLDNYFYEPFQDSKEVFEEDKIFETRPFELKKKLEPFSDTIFKFFLDGSRKTYKIGDIITPDNKFVPVVAGQIGAVCCGRNASGKMAKYELKRDNILFFCATVLPSGNDSAIIIHSFCRIIHSTGQRAAFRTTEISTAAAAAGSSLCPCISSVFMPSCSPRLAKCREVPVLRRRSGLAQELCQLARLCVTHASSAPPDADKLDRLFR